MEKIAQIVDFIWILFYFLKTAIRKIFFIPKKNPDLYIADRCGFFYNQSDIRYIPLKVLWDVLKIGRVIFNLNKRVFTSLYIRGGIPTGCFIENSSDLDFIFVSHNPNSCQSSVNYIIKNIDVLSKKYSKIDITVINYNDYEKKTTSAKINLLLDFQSVFLFGKKLKTKNKITKNDPTLWTFFSSYLSDNNKKNKILNSINEIEKTLDLSIKRPAAQQIIKTVVRGVFERTNMYGNVYTKNLFLIEKIFKKNVKLLAGNDKKQVENCLLLLTQFNSPLSTKKEMDSFKNCIIFTLNYF